MPSIPKDKRQPNGRFAKGNPGGGRPPGLNRKTIEIKQLAAQFLLDPAYLRSLAIRLRTGTAPHMERYLAEMLWGKPKDILEMQHMILNFYKVLYAESASENGQAQGADASARAIDVTPEWHRPEDASQLPPQELPASIPEGNASGMQARDARMAPEKW